MVQLLQSFSDFLPKPCVVIHIMLDKLLNVLIGTAAVLRGDTVELRLQVALTPAAKKGMDIATGRKWWAFQPVVPLENPKVHDAVFAKEWAKQKIDWLILEKLEQNKLKPSSPGESCAPRSS